MPWLQSKLPLHATDPANHAKGAQRARDTARRFDAAGTACKCRDAGGPARPFGASWVGLHSYRRETPGGLRSCPVCLAANNEPLSLLITPCEVSRDFEVSSTDLSTMMRKFGPSMLAHTATLRTASWSRVTLQPCERQRSLERIVMILPRCVTSGRQKRPRAGTLRGHARVCFQIGRMRVRMRHLAGLVGLRVAPTRGYEFASDTELMSRKSLAFAARMRFTRSRPHCSQMWRAIDANVVPATCAESGTPMI